MSAFGRDAVLDVRGELRVGAGVRVGERCRVVCHERVEVGDGAFLEDEVVLMDVGPVFDDPERPVREQGVRTAPVVIGAGAVLRKGCVVGPGVTVGEGAEVLHHAVVTQDVPAGAVAEGVPARVRRRRSAAAGTRRP